MAEKSHPFYVYSGLLTPEHIKNIKDAIWVFLWCLNKTTSEENGEGIVCGGNEVAADEIGRDLGRHSNTVRRHLRQLEQHAYLSLERGRRGYFIGVNKSKRWSGRFTTRGKSKPVSELPPVVNQEKVELPPVVNQNNADGESKTENPLPHSDLRVPQPVLTNKTLKPTTTTTQAGSTTNGEKPGAGGSVVLVYELIKTINTRYGEMGIPPEAMRTQLAALLKTWGMPRLIDVATENAGALDGKGWGYRLAVLRNQAEPKPKSKKCPNPKCRFGHFRTMGCFRNYATVKNPTFEVPQWAGVPHFCCPKCRQREKLLPGEFETVKAEAAEQKAKTPRRTRPAPVGLGDAITETKEAANVLS